MKLTDNFSLSEFTFSITASRLGLSNTPGPLEIIRLTNIAKTLEEVRALFDKPILISSGYRSPQLNKIIGGSVNSQHMKGEAADFNVAGIKPKDVIKAIIKEPIVFDQLILEYDSWVHISKKSKANRNQILIINNKGTRAVTASEFLNR